MSLNFEKSFQKFAIEAKGEKILYKEGFLMALSSFRPEPISKRQGDLLFRAADNSNLGYLTLKQFLEFKNVLESSDAEYQVIARLIGYQGTATVTAEQIKSFFSSKSQTFLDLASPAMKLAIGAGGNSVSYNEFCEFIKVARLEQLVSFFRQHDSKQTGFVSTADAWSFVNTRGDFARFPILLSNFENNFKRVSFPEFMALSGVLCKTDIIKTIVERAAVKGTKINKDLFLAESASLNALFTPMEMDILFRLVDGNTISSFYPLFGRTEENAVKKTVQLSALMETAKSIYNFALGSIAGACGAFAVYPIDLVKTRMQNQRKQIVGQVMYKNSLDCFKKVFQNEGILGLYSGLVPQLVGVAPEKAIKLAMNDLVRSRLKNQQTGEIPLWAEILAGSCAGGSQVLFTNPLEIVKIRLQVQGEVAKAGIEGAPPRMSAIQIVRQLGLLGLYKGVGACLLRDIPFSAIFFPAYAHLKKDYFQEGVNGKRLSIPELLACGALAGMPAAYSVTPADVIKTRLQVQARQGQQTYDGIKDAFVKILREEGPTAFYKGGLARIFRSSPQFGVTLATYELLQNTFHYDFGDNPKPNVSEPLLSAEEGKRKALKLFDEFSLK